MKSDSFTDSESAATENTLRLFNQVFLDRCPSALNELVAEDCIVENSQPAPDGERFEGKAACIALWSRIALSTEMSFEPESITARGDRGTINWRLRWGSGSADSVRGVNLMRVRDGQIVEAQGYVKAGA